MGFAPGDLVVCVSFEGVAEGVARPAPGHGKIQRRTTYVVEAVIHWQPDNHPQQTGLVIAGHHSTHPSRAYCSTAFRKVDPPEPAETEFTALIKRPVRKSERV